MSRAPASALLISPLPGPALYLLADALHHIDVAEDAAAVAEHDQVLLSGAVSGEAVAEVAAELSRRPDLQVGVDLAHPPTEGALAALGGFFHGGHTRIGHLPVTMVVPTGDRKFAHQDLEELASFVHSGASEIASGALNPEDVFALATDLAERDQRVEELEARVGKLRGRLERTQGQLAQARERVERLERKRAAAVARAEEAERHPAVLAAHRYRRLSRRVPGGTRTLALASAAVLLVFVVLLLLARPVDALAVLALVCCVLAVAGLALAAIALRGPRPTR